MADVYVATDGNDSNTGASISDPYATLQAASDDAYLSAGDTVWLVVKKEPIGVFGVGGNEQQFTSEIGTVTIDTSGILNVGNIRWRATNENGEVDGTMAVIDFDGIANGRIHIQAAYLFFQNISVKNAPGDGWLEDNNGNSEPFGTDLGRNLFFYGCSAISCGGDGFDCDSQNQTFYQCYASDCTGNGFLLPTNIDKNCFGCIAESCGASGFSSNSNMSCWYCIANNNTSYGFENPERMVNCTAANNTDSGIYKSNEDIFTIIMNNISVGNGGYAFEINPVSRANKWIANNAFSGTLNTSGTYDAAIDTAFEIEMGTVDLTKDPFVDSSLRNFSLNNDPGGGLLCKNTGKPFGQHTNSRDFIDIGAIQTSPRAIVVG